MILGQYYPVYESTWISQDFLWKKCGQMNLGYSKHHTLFLEFSMHVSILKTRKFCLSQHFSNLFELFFFCIIVAEKFVFCRTHEEMLFWKGAIIQPQRSCLSRRDLVQFTSHLQQSQTKKEWSVIWNIPYGWNSKWIKLIHFL